MKGIGNVSVAMVLAFALFGKGAWAVGYKAHYLCGFIIADEDIPLAELTLTPEPRNEVEYKELQRRLRTVGLFEEEHRILTSVISEVSSLNILVKDARLAGEFEPEFDEGSFEYRRSLDPIAESKALEWLGDEAYLTPHYVSAMIEILEAEARLAEMRAKLFAHLSASVPLNREMRYVFTGEIENAALSVDPRNKSTKHFNPKDTGDRDLYREKKKWAMRVATHPYVPKLQSALVADKHAFIKFLDNRSGWLTPHHLNNYRAAYIQLIKALERLNFIEEALRKKVK